MKNSVRGAWVETGRWELEAGNYCELEAENYGSCKITYHGTSWEKIETMQRIFRRVFYLIYNGLCLAQQAGNTNDSAGIVSRWTYTVNGGMILRVITEKADELRDSSNY